MPEANTRRVLHALRQTGLKLTEAAAASASQ
jgi:hypothetical protein